MGLFVIKRTAGCSDPSLRCGFNRKTSGLENLVLDLKMPGFGDYPLKKDKLIKYSESLTHGQTASIDIRNHRQKLHSLY
jgi:hypothetical protein